jgi:hypothetical protein
MMSVQYCGSVLPCQGARRRAILCALGPSREPATAGTACHGEKGVRWRGVRGRITPIPWTLPLQLIVGTVALQVRDGDAGSNEAGNGGRGDNGSCPFVRGGGFGMIQVVIPTGLRCHRARLGPTVPRATRLGRCVGVTLTRQRSGAHRWQTQAAEWSRLVPMLTSRAMAPTPPAAHPGGALSQAYEGSGPGAAGLMCRLRL